MKIGILSDTHNNADNTRLALDTFRAREVERLIHCGDIATPEIVYLFAGWQVTFVLGNVDRDWVALTQAAEAIGAPRPRLSHDVALDNGTVIGVTHGADRDVFYRLLLSDRYTVVCHGHTHERLNEFRPTYNVRVINPGALGGAKSQTRSVCVLDSDTLDVEFIEFPEVG